MRIRLLKRGRVVKSYKVKPDTFTIGSGKEATIRAANVPGLASKHALVWLDEGMPTLVPSAGCAVKVNGEDVQFARLSPDDIVSIGKLELQISAVDAPPDQASARALQPIGAGVDEDGPTTVESVPPRSMGAPTPKAPPPIIEDAPTRMAPVPAELLAATGRGPTPVPAHAPPPLEDPDFGDDLETTVSPAPPSAPPPGLPQLPDTLDPRAAPRPLVRPDAPRPSEPGPEAAGQALSRPVVAAGEEPPSPSFAAARRAPKPQIEVEHKPTALGVPLARVPGSDPAAPAAPQPAPIDYGQRGAAPVSAPAGQMFPDYEAPRSVEPRRAPEPAQPSPAFDAGPRALPDVVPAPPPADEEWYAYFYGDDEDEEDEYNFVEPFSLVADLAEAAPSDRSGPREKYTVAEVTRHSEGKLFRVETVMPGKSYRPDPSAPALLKMSRDGRATVAIGAETTGRVWVGGQESAAANFQSGGVTLSDGDRAVIQTSLGEFIINVFRPPRAATPGLFRTMFQAGMLMPYAIGVSGLLFGGLIVYSILFPPDLGPAASGEDEEQYELISQNDLTLLAPQELDVPDEEPIEEEVEDEGPVEEVPPEKVPRTTRRVRRSTSSSGGSSAASQLISALSSSGGGGGSSLQDVITNIDAVGSSSAGSALFRTSGIISKLPGGQVKLARRGAAGGVSTMGGKALSAASPGIGKMTSSGRTGKVRGRVSRVSSLMRVSGRLDRGDVLRVINGRIGAITRCYESRLVANPGLSGRIVFAWRVNEQGRVSGVSVRSSSIADAQVASCISRIIRGMRFPQPEGGAVSISFPFVFRAVDF